MLVKRHTYITRHPFPTDLCWESAIPTLLAIPSLFAYSPSLLFGSTVPTRHPRPFIYLVHTMYIVGLRSSTRDPNAPSHIILVEDIFTMMNLNLIFVACSVVVVAALPPPSFSPRATVMVHQAHIAGASPIADLDLFQTVIASTDSPAALPRIAPRTNAISPLSTWKPQIDIKASTIAAGVPFQAVIAATVPTAASPTALRKNGSHPLSTWKRRLDTKQDPFNVHKWAGMGWSLSSAVIFGVGALSGFTEVPEMLEPITYLFLISTLIQSIGSIPMALRYRSGEPLVQRGFISSAITTCSLAFTGYWLGPFAHEALDPTMVAGFVAFLVLVDAVYSTTSFEDMKAVLAKIKEIDPLKEAKVPQLYTMLLSTFPIGLPMNAFLLQQMYGHTDDAREYVLGAIAHRGSSSELVYYASMVTSIAVSIGNLAATCSHRKLISKDVENITNVGSIVVALVFNINAAGNF